MPAPGPVEPPAEADLVDSTVTATASTSVAASGPVEPKADLSHSQHPAITDPASTFTSALTPSLDPGPVEPPHALQSLCSASAMLLKHPKLLQQPVEPEPLDSPLNPAEDLFEPTRVHSTIAPLAPTTDVHSDMPRSTAAALVLPLTATALLPSTAVESAVANNPFEKLADHAFSSSYDTASNEDPNPFDAFKQPTPVDIDQPNLPALEPLAPALKEQSTLASLKGAPPLGLPPSHATAKTKNLALSQKKARSKKRRKQKDKDRDAMKDKVEISHQMVSSFMAAMQTSRSDLGGSSPPIDSMAPKRKNSVAMTQPSLDFLMKRLDPSLVPGPDVTSRPVSQHAPVESVRLSHNEGGAGECDQNSGGVSSGRGGGSVENSDDGAGVGVHGNDDDGNGRRSGLHGGGSCADDASARGNPVLRLKPMTVVPGAFGDEVKGREPGNDGASSGASVDEVKIREPGNNGASSGALGQEAQMTAI